jgi:hypothetical protein
VDLMIARREKRTRQCFVVIVLEEDLSMKNFKYALAATAALGTIAFGSASASAMPNGLSSAVTNELSSNIENVRWVCGPYRCWWRPNYYYGWYRPWGWRYGWRRW